MKNRRILKAIDKAIDQARQEKNDERLITFYQTHTEMFSEINVQRLDQCQLVKYNASLIAIAQSFRAQAYQPTVKAPHEYVEQAKKLYEQALHYCEEMPAMSTTEGLRNQATLINYCLVSIQYHHARIHYNEILDQIKNKGDLPDKEALNEIKKHFQLLFIKLKRHYKDPKLQKQLNIEPDFADQLKRDMEALNDLLKKISESEKQETTQQSAGTKRKHEETLETSTANIVTKLNSVHPVSANKPVLLKKDNPQPRLARTAVSRTSSSPKELLGCSNKWKYKQAKRQSLLIEHEPTKHIATVSQPSKLNAGKVKT